MSQRAVTRGIAVLCAIVDMLGSSLLRAIPAAGAAIDSPGRLLRGMCPASRKTFLSRRALLPQLDLGRYGCL